MQITLTPARMDQTLSLESDGDVLIFNGQSVNLVTYQQNPGCAWIIGLPVLGADGWQVEIILPHGANAPDETRFPAPLLIMQDGPVDLPPYDAVAAVAEDPAELVDIDARAAAAEDQA